MPDPCRPVPAINALRAGIWKIYFFSWAFADARAAGYSRLNAGLIEEAGCSAINAEQSLMRRGRAQ